MADRPFICAMANPDPEIKYELAKEANPHAIIATGRSDYPNQVNNVLGFPFIFRGALDVRARAINEEMKFAASKALYNLTREDVPDYVLRAYGVESMKFGSEYIIPKPLDMRVMLWESTAVAKAAMETGVARKTVDMDEYREQLAFRQGKGARMRYFFMNKARSAKPLMRVAFAEGEEPKIIRAAVQVEDEKIAAPILIGRPEIIKAKAKELALDLKCQIVDPDNFARYDKYLNTYYDLRPGKGCPLPRLPNASANQMCLVQ